MTAPATAAGRALLAMGASVGSTTADYRLRLIEQIEAEARAQGAADERSRLRAELRDRLDRSSRRTAWQRGYADALVVVDDLLVDAMLAGPGGAPR